MNKVYQLKSPILNYDWGDKQALFNLFAIENPQNLPQAEIWMGAHSKAPSEVLLENDSISLLEFIDRDPVACLGQKAATEFANKLPFLFKVLAAGKPLSIQSHPNLSQAKAGYDAEEQLAIPLDAFERNYKDDNHKPELICALTQFEALNGFRRIEQIIALFELIDTPLLVKPLAQLKASQDKAGLKEFYRWLMSLSQKDSLVLTQAAVVAAKLQADNKAYQTLDYLNEFYPNDIGILCALLLNVITLSPGEAMYLEAGEYHAYLSGVGMEIMANSDNVLRGGLTSKHVDKAELLKVLSFNYGDLDILTAQSTAQDAEKEYRTPAREFSLSVINLEASQNVDCQVTSVEILFCSRGKGELFCSGNTLPIEKGHSYLVPASVGQYSVIGDVQIFRSRIPQHLS